MKRIISVIIVIALLICVIIFQSIRLNNRTKEYEVAIQNNKAYENQLDVVQEENKVF